MDVREKLVELLAGCPCESDCVGMVGSCPNRRNGNCNEIFKLSYCAVSKLAQHLIAHGVTVQEWISVKDERKPKIEEDVLVVVFDGYNTYTSTDCIMKHGDWCYNTGIYKVTHWQPMPQPPKGE